MKGIETGKDKVRKICEVLKSETLEPAKKEAEHLVDQAQAQAGKILDNAQAQAAKMKAEALKEIERERNVFQSSLNQACKQALESLKDEIEEKLFNQELSKILSKPLQDPKVIVDLISAVIRALEKDGTDSDLSVYIPSSVPARSVNTLLLQDVLQKLKGGSVELGSMKGGIQVKVLKENITIDVTDEALKELVANYIRKDFREILLGAK